VKIAFVTHYGALLGANRSLLHLVTGLRRWHGVEPLVLCPERGAFTEALEREGVACWVKPFANAAYTIRTRALYAFPWRWYRTRRVILPALVAALREFQPDVVHSNSSAVALGWQLAEALEKPHVWHIREFGTFDYRLIHPLGKRLFFEKLERSAAVILISRALRSILPPGFSAPVHVIYNGIGPEAGLREAYAAARRRAPDGLFRFLLIGLLHPQKQQDVAIEAFAPVGRRYPHARLVLAGDGRRGYAEKLRAMVRRLGLEEKVVFTGYVPSPAPLFAAADAVLMCSRYEAMGRVTAEAMAFGKPVIGFAGGATPELIRHGETGFLYREPGELTDFMLQLIENQNTVEKIGEHAHRFALENFTDERYTAAFFAVVKGLLPS
jgi:glycosyltransferase involved in cell wall biosynthesis